MTREWDAASYERLSTPQTRWGRAVVDRLELGGTERVLDAGCGTGRVTELLLERLPEGHVIGVDGSAAMIEQAAVRFAGDPRVGLVVADLTEPLQLDGPLDAILSTATFHWIADHSSLFRNLASVLRPGGQLVAQCGGEGNIATLERIVSEMGHTFGGQKTFATAEETRDRLEGAGFEDIETWLHEEPTTLPEEDLEAFLETVCLGGIVHGMGEDERERLVREVATRMPEPRIDYVRLNISARKASARSGFSAPSR
jgi:trans-aconitate 2-methyltransferase